MKPIVLASALWSFLFLVPSIPGYAAGALASRFSAQSAIQATNHHVKVIINNGYAMTEVQQAFFNPNESDLEAIYTFSLPVSASLSEVSVFTGGIELHGEVLDKKQAEKTYEEEKRTGGDAGLVTKGELHEYQFNVSRIPAKQEARIRYVYYQPVKVDSGVGRYVYPVEQSPRVVSVEGSWRSNVNGAGSLSIDLELKSAGEIEELWVPNFESLTKKERIHASHYRVEVKIPVQQATDRDFVFYYWLRNDAPGRLAVVTHRSEPNARGTFMAVMTPGLDLQPLVDGADYIFILDVSQSMEGELPMLKNFVGMALGQLRPSDRYRIIIFQRMAKELTQGWTSAVSHNVEDTFYRLNKLMVGGRTNLYDGVQLGLNSLSVGRATSIVLLTDGVTNTGTLSPNAFYRLLKRYDVRLFGFVMGDNANWPLMRTICDASGGFAISVSNPDDMSSLVHRVSEKMSHECLHDATLHVEGVSVSSTTDGYVSKVFRGQQLVLFGRYTEPGSGNVVLKAKLTGREVTYRVPIRLPEIEEANPEIERLWAFAYIEMLKRQEAAGVIQRPEAQRVIRQLGLGYQLVTDYTAMTLLEDNSFLRRGIARNNEERIAKEKRAQIASADNKKAGKETAKKAKEAVKKVAKATVGAPLVIAGGIVLGATGGGGAGAFDPLTAAIAVALGGIALGARRKSKTAKKAESYGGKP